MNVIVSKTLFIFLSFNCYKLSYFGSHLVYLFKKREKLSVEKIRKVVIR